MDRKRLLVPVLLVAAAANLRLGCTVQVAGKEISEAYSPKELRICEETARSVAEEICGRAVLPEVRKRYFITPALPDGDEKILTDALLRSTSGVAVMNGVYVNGRRLGCVKNGDMLRYLMERNIDAQMPAAAVSGDYSGEIEIKTEYCAEGSETAYADMLLLIEGAAPVIYINDEGERA